MAEGEGAGRVRGARGEDAAAIAAVHVASWKAAYRGQIPDEVLDGLDVETRTRQWGQWLADDRIAAAVAESAGSEVVGFCSLVATFDEDDDPAAVASIPTLYVSPACWRRGWGEALCRWAVDSARSRGFVALTLWVLESNTRARRFYEALGFDADGSRRVDDSLTGTPLAEVRYRIRLADPPRPSG